MSLHRPLRTTKLNTSLTYDTSVSSKTVKNAIWLYLFFVLFEGAFRKWILPQLASPLLIVRDPIALYIIFIAFRDKLFEKSFVLFVFFIVSLISIPLAVFFGHGNLSVAVFGARIFFLHMPIIFIMGKSFSFDDVIKFGKFIVILTIPSTILLALQFYSPQSAFVNIGVAGDTNGAGFGAIGDFFRPPGLFSFTSGNVFFYCLNICFILSFWFSQVKYLSQWLLVTSTLFFIIAVPLCISRTLIFQIVISLIFVLIAVAGDKKLLFRIFLVTLVVISFIPFIGSISIFQDSSSVLIERFTSANEAEGGLNGVLIDRFLGGLYSAIFSDHSNIIPYWGYGVGKGTNVGAQLLTGSTSFLISEGEWGRLIGELGLLLGISLIISRIWLGVNLLIKSFSNIKSNNVFSWMLMSFGFLTILQNQLGPPTNLGFTVMVGGLSMASLKKMY